MANDYKVLTLIHELNEIVSSAPRYLLSGDRCIIDREEVLSLLQEIGDVFPSDLEAAQSLLDIREKLLSKAEEEGESIRQRAKQRSLKMISESEITATARQGAKVIEREALERAAERKKEADDYVAEAQRRARAIDSYANKYTKDRLDELRKLLRGSVAEIDGVFAATLSHIDETEKLYRSVSRSDYDSVSDKAKPLPYDQDAEV